MPLIRDALILQKDELQRKREQRYIHRTAKINGIKSNIIKVITGPRRAGKSFFAVHELGRQGRFAYANFDDETLAGASDYNEIVTELGSIYGKPEYLLFDEIQNLAKWELFVNRLQRQGHNLVITGSNSNLLSSELATHLTGRHTSTTMLPLSFNEFLSYGNEGREPIEAEVKARFSYYAEHGGYPEPLVKGLDYKDYLSTLFDSILYKDIVRRYKIRKPAVVEELATYLVSNTAREFSYRNLTSMTGSESGKTIKRYMDYLKEAFILFEVSRYSTKVREQITSNKKVYCIDNGLIHSKAFKTTEETGRLYENLAAIELKRRQGPGGEFYYWKNAQQEEIDFLLRKDRRVTGLIQVCADISRSDTKSREIRALLKGSKELKCNNLIVLTGGYDSSEAVEWFGIKRKVNFVPIWRWLLDGNEAHEVPTKKAASYISTKSSKWAKEVRASRDER
jgi:hypothetical protein